MHEEMTQAQQTSVSQRYRSAYAVGCPGSLFVHLQQTERNPRIRPGTTRMTRVTKSGRATAAVILLVAVQFIGACQPAEDQPGSLQTSVLALKEAYRIGDETAGDSVLLGAVRGLAVDSRGQLYITDSGFDGIRVYSLDGVQVDQIGREGRGPGEFARTPTMRIGPGDSLYAWDSYAGQLSIFAPHDHSFVSRLAVGLSESDRLYPTEFLAATSRGFLFRYSPFFSPGSDELSSKHVRVKLVDSNGTIVDESVAELPPREGLAIATGTSVTAYGLPFAVSPHFAIGSTQVLYYGSDDAIRIASLSLQGTNRGEFTVPISPIPLTDAEREQTIAEAPDDFHGLLRERLPAIKPAFSRLVPDDAGRLWIELTQREGEESRTWLIVDDAGIEIARASVPENVRLRVVQGSRAYGTMTDEATGAPIVAAWDILP